MADSLTVLIGDSDEFMVEALASVLNNQPGIKVVKTATDADTAALAMAELRPAVAILDMELAFENGASLISRFSQLPLPDGIVFIGNRIDPSTVAEFIFSDPSGMAFLKKSQIGSVDKLVRAVRAVADGSTLLDDEMFRRFLVQSEDSGRNPVSGLTSKEHEVLACIANADSNSRIAEKLSLRARTVENYVANIFAKLGARRRSGRDPRVQAALHYLSVTGRLEGLDAVPEGPAEPAHPIELFVDAGAV